MNSSNRPSDRELERLFPGDSELAGRMRALDWSQTDLGPPEHWPENLRVADVMMPRLDGFGLLRELRADPRIGNLPVIMLSARAGEESRVEGMEVGADDYLVKPFSARELLARVGAHLQMARLRGEANESVRESEERLQIALDTGKLGSWQLDFATLHLDCTATGYAGTPGG